MNPITRMLSVFAMISEERLNQEKLKAEGRFQYTCVDPEASHGQCFAIVLEEIGEVAQAIASREHDPLFVSLAMDVAALGEKARAVLNMKGFSNDPPGPHKPDRQLYKELKQSAAVLVAWLEGFKEKVYS